MMVVTRMKAVVKAQGAGWGWEGDDHEEERWEATTLMTVLPTKRMAGDNIRMDVIGRGRWWWWWGLGRAWIWTRRVMTVDQDQEGDSAGIKQEKDMVCCTGTGKTVGDW